jgi:hypothetical protein
MPTRSATLVDLLELRRLLDHQHHRAAELRRQERGLDVLLVLVAVADDQRLVVLVDRHDGEELGLAARLEAVVERAAELDDLLDHGPVLVDLDRVDAAVLALVVVLLDRAVERAADQLDPRPQHVGEAQQDRQLDAAAVELVDQLAHVDLAVAGAARRDDQVALLADVEVAAAPALDAVGLQRLRAGPAAERILCKHRLRSSHGSICYGLLPPHAMPECSRSRRGGAGDATVTAGGGEAGSARGAPGTLAAP